MKHLILFFAALTILSSCKTDKKTEESTTAKELTILEKVAYAHGFEHWKKVKQIQFTFNVDRGGSSSGGRTWNWRTKSNDVLFMSANDTVSYNRNNIDSLTQRTNAGFTNDKFWLLAPFNLVWDKENITYVHEEKSEAPICKKPMQKLTIVYGDKGGYTPGDAYDFYFEDDYIIKEWVFRKGNTKKPSMITTWENYVEQHGLKIALEHKNADGNFKLFFSEVKTVGKN